ncbi:MAG: pitrilysin family protein [Armatimonadota bacterium]
MNTKLIKKFTIMLIILYFVLAASLCQGQVIERKLDNGLTVLMKQSSSAPVFTAQIWFKVGSRNEHTGITGISHFLEHMLFNSSKNYKKGEISKRVRALGGIDNAATSFDYTYYWVLLSKEHLDFALESLAERVGGALLLEDEIETERTVILSELEGKENSPDTVLFQALASTAFRAHPYSWPVIGWRSDIEKISKADLDKYYKTYYSPANAILVLVGDIDIDSAWELVKKHFADIPAGDNIPEVRTIEPQQIGAREVIVNRPGETERVILGFKAPPIDNPDSYPLMVLDQILSGGRSSRFHQAIVEKGLAISAWTSYFSTKDGFLFMIGATPKQRVNLVDVEKALWEQIEEIKYNPPTEDELQRAINQYEAYLIYENDSVSDQGKSLGYFNSVNSWNYINTLIPAIKSVKPVHIQLAAQKYLTNQTLTTARFIPSELISDSREKIFSVDKISVSKEDSIKPQKKIESYQVFRATLDNGIKLIVQQNPSNPTIAITASIKAGSIFDPAYKSGTASLTADNLKRGTIERSSLSIANEIDNLGAEISFSANIESLSINAKCLSRDIDKIIELMADQLINPIFDKDEFSKSKSEIISKLKRAKESPSAMAERAFNGAIFPFGHPYHELNVDDSIKNIQNIESEDIKYFHNKYYKPNNMIITIVGDISGKEAEELIKKHFGKWKDKPEKIDINIETITKSKSQKIIKYIPGSIENVVLFGFPLGVKRSDPDFYKIRIANQILGGGGSLSSILGIELREERGLVYGVWSSFDATLGAGAWKISLGVSNQNTDNAVAVLQETLKSFSENGVTEEQFRQAKDFLIGVFPIALETNEGIANALHNAEFYGLGDNYILQYRDLIKAVTLDEVNEAIKKYFNPKDSVIVIAGPYRDNNS